MVEREQHASFGSARTTMCSNNSKEQWNVHAYE